MAKKFILEIAKAGKDLTTAVNKDKALYSPMFLPKIYAVKKMTPDIPEGWVSGDYEYEHGLSYPPMYLYYEQQNYFQNNPASVEFDPERYVYGSQARFANMDGTRFANKSGSLDAYLVCFLDPLKSPATAPESTTHGSPRLKIGEDLVDSPDYLADTDSKYQTLKVHMQGQLSCSVPEWESTGYIGGDAIKFNWFTVTHNLGYPPVHTPFVNTVGLSLDMAYEDSIPTTFTANDVNDSWAERWAYDFGWAGVYIEGLWIYVDTTKYYVGYKRQNLTASTAHTFPARTVKVNYTIFNLPINEEFNLLA